MKVKLDALTRITWEQYCTLDYLERMVERDRKDNPEAGLIIEDGMITGYII